MTAEQKIGWNYPFEEIRKAYKADPPSDTKSPFLLYKDGKIVALCLREKFNPKSDEVWVGDDAPLSVAGAKLADRTSPLPLYYSPRGRTLYEFKGMCMVIGSTTKLEELASRKGPVPLSRIVFIKVVS